LSVGGERRDQNQSDLVDQRAGPQAALLKQFIAARTERRRAKLKEVAAYVCGLLE